MDKGQRKKHYGFGIAGGIVSVLLSFGGVSLFILYLFAAAIAAAGASGYEEGSESYREARELSSRYSNLSILFLVLGILLFIAGVVLIVVFSVKLHQYKNTPISE